MKKTISPLTYPVVIRQHLNFMTFSVPDLGITLIEDMPPQNRLDSYYVTRIGKKVAEAWLKAQKILKDKTEFNKALPHPSLVKDAVRTPEKALTPASFAKLVGVSRCTVTRDCKSGIIRAIRTSGGHYKIPIIQVSIYLDYLKNHTKHATDNWLKEAVAKLQDMRE